MAAVASAPAPPARAAQPPAAAPGAAERDCVGCRPGESALGIDAELAGGAGCPAELSARLRQSAPEQLAALTATLPAGCAVLRVEVPPTARYTGFRYAAGAPHGTAAACLPGSDCPDGGRFLGSPIVRWDGRRQVVLAPFESATARRAELTVFVRGARR